MSDLPGLLAVAVDNTVSEVRLSPTSLAVLLYALGKIDNWREWTDYRGEVIPQEDIETIHDIVDQASLEVMTPIVTIPVGGIMMWGVTAPPDRWILCGGQQVFKADYPELWALWGSTFGTATTDMFTVLNMIDRSPMGADAFLDLNEAAGAFTHTLTTPEMPAHTHSPLSPNTSFVGGRSGGSNALAAGSSQGAVLTTGSTGGGTGHNNLHPVRGVKFIVYGGKV